MALVAGSRAEVTVNVNGTEESRRQIETVGGALSQLGGRATALHGTLGALGVLAGATAFAVWIKGAIDATDAASDLSQKTGIAIEDLAGLELAYQMGGMEADALASSQTKLSKAMVEGNAGLEKLGINAKNLDGSLKSNKAVLYSVADSFAAMEDGAEKTALAMTIFGKSGADMIPMLNGGSAGLREMDDMARKLGLTLSEEAVEKAGAFNDTLDLLMLGGQGVARGIAAELLPTLSSLAGSFLTSMTEGDRLKNTAHVLASGLKILYSVGVGIVEVFSTVGKVIGGLAAMMVNNLKNAIDVLSQVADGDFQGAWNSVKRTVASTSDIAIDAAKDVGAGWVGAWNTVAGVWDGGGDKMVETMAKINRSATVTGQSAAEVKKQTEAANKERAEEAKVVAELSGVTATYMADLSRLNDMYEKSKVTKEQYIELVNQLIAKQPGAKKAIDDAAKAAADYAKVTDEAREAVETDIEAIHEQVRALETKVATYGMLPDAITAVQIAELEASSQSLALTDQGVADIQRKIDALKKLRAVQGEAQKQEAAADAAKESLDSQKQVWQSVEQTAHATFVSIFDSGKSAFDRLKDTLKNGLLDMLYQMTLKKWIINISGQVSSQGELSQAASLLGGSGGNGSLLGSAASLYSAGKTMYSGFTGGLATTLGGYASSAGTIFGSSAMSSFGAGMSAAGGNSGMAAMYASAQTSGNLATGASAGMSAGSALPIVGWIAAGMSLSNALYKQGWNAENGSLTDSLGGKAIMPFNAPMLHLNQGLQKLGMSDSLANMFSGASTVSRLFGRKNPEIQRQGLQGTISDSGFSGNAYADIIEKGGTFRSSKRYTNTASLSGEQEAGLDTTVQAMIMAVKGFGAAMGLETSVINGYTKSIKLELGSDEAKNQEALAKMFGDIGDDLSRRLVPSIASLGKAGETASATLQRVATNYMVVDSALSSIGKQFGEVGVQSIAARERLVDLFGGAETLAQVTTSYAQNFLTEAERLKPVADALAVEMGRLGMASVTTRAQFKQVIDGLNLSTEAGAAQYAALMSLADAFAAVHPATEGAVADLSTYRSALTDAYNAEAEALQATASRLGTFATSLRNLKESALLGNLSPLSPQEKYAEAARQFEATVAAARADDPKAQANFESVRTAFLEASRAINASSAQYQHDFSYAQAVTEDAARWAERTAAGNEAQLAVLKAQVSSLIDINKSVLSVREALLQYNQAMSGNGAPATVMPPPVSGSITFYESEGRTNNAALEAQLYAVRAELAGLRADQRQQTGAVIEAQYGAADESATQIGRSFKKAAYYEERVSPE